MLVLELPPQELLSSFSSTYPTDGEGLDGVLTVMQAYLQKTLVWCTHFKSCHFDQGCQAGFFFFICINHMNSMYRNEITQGRFPSKTLLLKRPFVCTWVLEMSLNTWVPASKIQYFRHPHLPGRVPGYLWVCRLFCRQIYPEISPLNFCMTY
jgi:hypothetical protein